MFSKILGNDDVKQSLMRMAAAGRVPNAVLFSGPEGVGKRQFALELARSFVCRQPADGAACGECAACVRAGEFTFPKPEARDDFKRVIFSNHPDVGTIVAPGRNILVDAVRDLETEANFRPYEGRARTFIVDDADKMNANASNALLKTLEEPPASTHIFLITSRPDHLLPTIRSRAQMFRFAPVAVEQIRQYLVTHRAMPESEAELAARLANGSIGRAALIDVEQYTERRERMLSAVSHALTDGSRTALLRTAEQMSDAKNKEMFEENLNILESLIHDIWSIGAGREAGELTNADIAARLSDLAEYARSADLPAWLAAVQTVRENLAVNINKKIAADAMFVGMTA